MSSLQLQKSNSTSSRPGTIFDLAANIYRIATNLATNQLTWRIAERHPTIGALVAKYRTAHDAGLKTLAGTMGRHTAETLEGVRLITYLREMLATGRATLVHDERHLQSLIDDGKAGTIAGYANDDGSAYLLGDTVIAMVKKAFCDDLGNYPNSVLYDHLASLNWLASKANDGKATQNRRILGKQTRVLHVKNTALDGVHDTATEAEEIAAAQKMKA